MKTLLELSQELNVPKQKIYRYIKKHIIEVHHETGVMYIDETAETILKQVFNQDELHQENTSDVHHEAHRATSDDTILKQFEAVIDILKIQLQEKDKQIEQLQKLLDQQQQLYLVEQTKSLPILKEKQSIWNKIFSKN